VVVRVLELEKGIVWTANVLLKNGKMIKKLANWLLNISEKKDQIQKVKVLKSEPFVNKYFAEAMEKGELETEPYIILSDGTEIYLSKLGSVSYENYLIATQEIPRQYEEFGLRREKLLSIHEQVRENVRQAQVIMHNDAIQAHKILENASNLILGLNSEVGFGSPVRQHIEQVMCFLNTKQMNPYIYDWSEKNELMYKILYEWELVKKKLIEIPIWILMGLENPYNIDSWYYLHKELMERPEIKLQLVTLQRNVLADLKEQKEMSKGIIQEFMILQELVKIGSEP
jgi:hypothetical protein